MGHGPQFDPSALTGLFTGPEPPRRVIAAFSGGVDSTALLLALSTEGRAHGVVVEAVHADHGVHPDSDRWTAHCAAVCDSLRVPLHRVGPPTAPLPAGSPEERLRRWRYQEFEALLGPGDVLCTAHHLEDQAETMLLAMLRASGPEGLAAMPPARPLGLGVLARPLLPVPRNSLIDWLEAQPSPWLGDERALGRWIEDPSNETRGPDRNYLRHEILPRLRERWPATDRNVATSARLCAEAAHQLGDAAALVLAGRQPAPDVLDVGGLGVAAEPLGIVLRTWLKASGAAPLPRSRLEELTAQIGRARADARIETCWAEHRLRHHRGRLWLDSPDSAPGRLEHMLTPGTGLDLGPVTGQLTLEPAPTDSDLVTSRPDDLGALQLPVRSREPGDRIRPRPGGPSRSLKQWFSSAEVPPWLRDAIPLIPGDQELRAIGQTVLDPVLQRTLSEARLTLRWRPADPGLAWAWRECSGSLLGLE
jgi:tRNA(Ile)-lysidine synthase